MKIDCVWEHNGNDSLLYVAEYPGAFTRGFSCEDALMKMPNEIASYLRWRGLHVPQTVEVIISQEKESELQICDADSDVLFDTECVPLTLAEYEELKLLALKSAVDFQRLYDAIPDKHRSVLPERKTFYGNVPRTAQQMYDHTMSVNAYYFGEIDVPADSAGSVLSCRQRGFDALEQQPDYLSKPVINGSYGELWTLRKVLRRFVWHDRIHAKAMYRMAVKTFGCESVPNIFGF